MRSVWCLPPNRPATTSAYPAAIAPRFRIGGRIALWEGLLPQRVGRMRASASDVAIRSEIGFEEDLMRHLIEGSLDIGLMYIPGHSPGLWWNLSSARYGGWSATAPTM